MEPTEELLLRALEQAHRRIKELEDANDTLREIVLDLQDFMDEEEE